MSCGARPPAKIQEQIVHSLVEMTPPELTTDALAWSMPPTDLSDQMLYLSVKIDDVPTSFDVRVSDGTNAQTFSLASSQGMPYITDGEWVGFSIPWTPGPVDRSRVTDISLRVAGATQLAVARVGTVDEPVARYPNGVLSFTFDDTFDLTYGAAVLDAYRFPATAYTIVDYVDIPEHATLAQLHERQDHGWDIAAHSFTGEHHATRWPNLSPVELEDDIVNSREWLIANGFNGYDHCAYPGGEYSPAVLAMIERYFSSCRTIYQRQREAAPPSDARKLRVAYITSATPLSQLLAQLDEAVATRSWMIVVVHKLADAPEVSTEWRKSDFTTLVEHVAASGITVQTVSQVLTSQNGK